MHPLDLHVEQRIGRNADATVILDPARQSDLVLPLGRPESLEKPLVADMRLKPAQAVKVGFPAVTQRFGDQPGKRTVAHLQPAARRHAVRLVHDARMQRLKFRKQVLFHQIGMQRGNPVHLVRHDHGQLAHPHFMVLDDPHPMRARGIGFAVPTVDPFDDLHMARQDIAEGIGRPAFQRLGQKRVVGIAQTGARRLHRVRKLHPVVIDQQADQLWPGNGGVRVVHLDGDMFGQVAQRMAPRGEAAQDVLQRGRGQEEFLFQPQLFALIGGVIRVKHAAERAGQRFRFGRGGIVTAVETVEVKERGRFRRPEPQRIGPFPLPADDGGIIGLGQHGFAGHPDLAPGAGFQMALETDGIGGLGAFEFPRVALGEPVFRRLDLTALFEPLTEQPVFIADAIAISGAAHRRHAFHETGRKPPQPAIPQRGIGFILDNRTEILPQIGHRGLGQIAQAQVDRRILKQAPDQEFHRQIVDALVTRFPGLAGRGEPRLDDPVANREGQRHAPIIAAGMGRILAQSIGQVAKDVCLELRRGQVCHVTFQS